MLKQIIKTLCTKENVAMALLAAVGAALAISSSATQPEVVANNSESEPDFDFDRDVYRSPEYFKDVMEDLGIWTPEEKV